MSGERDENTCREDFKPSEAVAMGERLEPFEEEAAKERQGTRTDKHSGNFPQGSTGKTRDKVAAGVGMSARSYKKAAEVVEAAKEEPEKYGTLVVEMDRTGRVNEKQQRTGSTRTNSDGVI